MAILSTHSKFNSMSNNTSFLSTDDFLVAINSIGNAIKVLRSKSSGKLFMAIGTVNYKVQQSIDSSKPIRVLVPPVSDTDSTPNFTEACLVNVNPDKGAEEVFTL